MMINSDLGYTQRKQETEVVNNGDTLGHFRLVLGQASLSHEGKTLVGVSVRGRDDNMCAVSPQWERLRTEPGQTVMSYRKKAGRT